MTPRLLNVRLDDERVRKVQMLRERGVALSDLVREAIDERFANLRPFADQRDVSAIIKAIFEQHPDPADLPAREYDVHDRHAAQRAILEKLRTVRLRRKGRP
jgi:hypothetical protein